MGKNIDSFEFEGQIRIRTERQRKRAVREDADKQILKKHKEYKRLCVVHKELPMIDLDPPVQRGWKRYFVLREDVRRSKEAVFYENLLLKINTLQYSPTKIFKTRKRKKGKRISEEKEQHLRQFYPYEMAKMKFTDKELAHFAFKTKVSIKGNKMTVTEHYEFNEPWRYVLRVRPNVITQVQVFDADLNQRIDQLRDELWDDPIKKGRYDKLKGRRKYKWPYGELEKYSNPLTNKRLCDIDDV